MYTTEDVDRLIWQFKFCPEVTYFVNTAKSRYGIDSWTEEALIRIDEVLKTVNHDRLALENKLKLIDALVDEYYKTKDPALDIRKVYLGLMNKKFSKLFDCSNVSLDDFGFYGEPEDFGLLEIEPTPELEKIKEAYRKMVKKYHPDLHPGNEEKFREVTDAYERLIVGK